MSPAVVAVVVLGFLFLRKSASATGAAPVNPMAPGLGQTISSALARLGSILQRAQSNGSSAGKGGGSGAGGPAPAGGGRGGSNLMNNPEDLANFDDAFSRSDTLQTQSEFNQMNPIPDTPVDSNGIVGGLGDFQGNSGGDVTNSFLSNPTLFDTGALPVLGDQSSADQGGDPPPFDNGGDPFGDGF